MQPYLHGGDGDARSLSYASSGGSLPRGGWLGRLTGALHLRRGGYGGGLGSVGQSELGSPRSGVYMHAACVDLGVGG